MKKVILEETFLISNIIVTSRNYRIKPGLYKRLILSDNKIVWVEFNDGKNDYGGHSNMNYVGNIVVIKELELLYKGITREEQMKSVIE